MSDLIYSSLAWQRTKYNLENLNDYEFLWLHEGSGMSNSTGLKSYIAKYMVLYVELSQMMTKVKEVAEGVDQ